MIQVDTQISFDHHMVQHRFTTEQNRVVLFGASGAGKSVLLKMIAGFFNPDRGSIAVGPRVLFNSETAIDVPVHMRRIGYLPQEYTLFPNLNVIDNILYGIRVQKKALDQQWLDTLLTRLDIRELLKRAPASLSGGQQQRVALARILIIRPDILLLDEPFTALDSAIRESLRDMVIDLVDELDIKTMLVTHDMDEAFVFAKEMVLVHEGEVIEAGNRDALYRKPQFVESAELLGFANILPTVTIEGRTAVLESGDRFHFTGDFEPAKRIFCIRPEDIIIIRPDNENELKSVNIVSGTVRQLFHHGRYVKMALATDSGLTFQITVPVHVYDRLEPELGSPLQVFLKESAIVMCQPKNG